MWNNDSNLIDCSTDALNIFGFSGKQEFINGFMGLVMEYQPDGRVSSEVISEAFRVAFEIGYFRFEYWHPTVNGELVPLDVPLMRTKYKDDYVVIAYSRDLREQKAMIAQIEKKTD